MPVVPIGKFPLNLPVCLDLAPSEQEEVGEDVRSLLAVEADREAASPPVEAGGNHIEVINTLSHWSIFLQS